MSEALPAWSEAFHGEGPGPAPSLGLHGLIDADWAYGDRTGRGVRVAIIDSGVDADHPAVGGVAEYAAISVGDDGSVVVVDEPHDDLYGHGTACAAIVRELAPEVDLVSVRVLGANLRGSTAAFAAGVQWCIDHAVAVANLSLSTTNVRFAAPFHDLVDAAAFRGMLLVSAMSNEASRSIPSEFAGVFSVACGPGTDRERLQCNPHGPADWAAPGIDVEIAWTGGATICATGNSFAAPVVSGHLARIVGAHPGLTVWQVRTILAELADNAGTRS